MEYEVFKNVVASRIKDFLPPVFGAFAVEICDVPKNNGMKEALIMRLTGGDISISAPNVYLEDLYREFSVSDDLDQVIQTAAAFILNFTGRVGGKEMMANPEELRESIVPVLINTECNKEMLEEQTHREWLDLTIAYRIIAKMDEELGYAAAILTREFQEDLGLTDEQLEELAEKNRENLLPVNIVQLADGLAVLTSDKVIFGAYNMTRKDVLKEVADRMKDDLYLVTESIHEVMAIKSGDVTKRELKALLENGDRKNSDDNEFLSDNVYFYSRDTETVTILEL